MPRIAGVNILEKKRIVIALTHIHGIGKSTAINILKQLAIDSDSRAETLSDDQVHQIREMVEKHHRVEGDLRRDVFANIKRLKEIGAYRGSRHAKHLPARGQRTKTNSRTVRGNKRSTMGSGRRALTKT